MPTNRDVIVAARAAAILTSNLPSGPRPTRPGAAALIATAVRAHGGIRGCAAEVAAAYGERPETAAPRMRCFGWADPVVLSRLT